MEHKEKLRVVETAIRKVIPRLKELSQGCKLEKDGHYYTYLGKFMVNVSPYTDGYYLHHFSSEEVVVPKKGKDVFIHSLGDKKFKHYNIVGHDILISDMLEWLRHIDLGCFAIYDNGYLVDLELLNFDVKIDLSKPRLADQSEELWDFLYNLIEE